MAIRLDQRQRLLSALPLFRLLEPEALHVLAFNAEERRLNAGQILFRREDASDGGYVIAQGRIALAASAESITGAAIHEAGALIGEAALIAETKRPAAAVAVEPTVLLFLSRPLMHRVLEAHPASAAELRRHVAATMAATEFELRSVLD